MRSENQKYSKLKCKLRRSSVLPRVLFTFIVIPLFLNKRVSQLSGVQVGCVSALLCVVISSLAFGRPRRRWEDNIKIYLKETAC
jgi:hypothetical protein